MQYLVDLKLADSGRSATPQEGLAFIEHYILPTLELCKKLQAEKKIIAGGPISGVIGLALIVEANSALELDEIIENLPMWPRMNTTVTPLTTFDGRIQAILQRLERIKARLQGQAAASH
jgi:muconolactone delta-isomerase